MTQHCRLPDVPNHQAAEAPGKDLEHLLDGIVALLKELLALALARQSNFWSWAELKPWLEEKFNQQLPERFPTW